MDQLKVFLSQMVHYRFWIAVGISAILPIAAYFAGSGNLAEEEKAEKSKTKTAYDEVKTFAGGSVKNKDWTQVVEEKTQALTEDVNASWRKLYARQAPLLTWPKSSEKAAQERIEKLAEWGRKYPEGVDPQRIRDVSLDYMLAYPGYVEEVYQSFKPFNRKDGTGIVDAAPKESLLEPQTFREESPPTLGVIWSVQEKLWIQRTILDVIAKVNERGGAKDWDSAIVKRIDLLTVANAYALDQRSEAKAAEILENAPEIVPPGAEAATAPAAGTPGPAAGGGRFGAGESLEGASAVATEAGSVQYVKSANPDQYFTVPIALTVQVEQDHVNDLLVEFANSPMSIQVLDFEFVRPLAPIRKPRKGEADTVPSGLARVPGGRAGGLGGDMLGLSSGPSGAEGSSIGGMDDMAGYGAGGSAYNQGGQRRGSMQRMGDMSTAGQAGTAKGPQGGESVVQKNIEALKNKAKKDDTKDKAPQEEEFIRSNPYPNIVEVRIKGQARFYKAPPLEVKTEPTSPAAPAEGSAAEPTPTDANAPGASPADGTKVVPAEEPRGEPAKNHPGDEPAKTDTPPAEAKPATDVPKDEPKVEPGKADAPKS